jgi:N-acetylglutamate synthase-like GNAT family acetyltransferase
MKNGEGRIDLEPFVEGHLPHVLQLIRAAIRAGSQPYYSETQIAAWISSQTVIESSLENCTLVATWRGEVVGVAGADRKSAYPLRFVFVAPECWSRGIGRALVAALEEFCAQGGVRTIYVAAALNAVEFYAAMGYAPHGSLTILLAADGDGSEPVKIEAIEMFKAV